MVGLSGFSTQAYPMIFPDDDTFMATASYKLPSFSHFLEIFSAEDIQNLEVNGKNNKVDSAVMRTPKILRMLEKFKVLALVDILVALEAHICAEIKESIVKTMLDNPEGRDLSIEGDMLGTIVIKDNPSGSFEADYKTLLFFLYMLATDPSVIKATDLDLATDEKYRTFNPGLQY